MSDKPTGGPAWPEYEVITEGDVTATSKGGLTIRDYFAAAALSGMLSDPQEPKWQEHSDQAANAFKFADAMLAEREK